jgi:hypothetical protein
MKSAGEKLEMHISLQLETQKYVNNLPGFGE